MRFLLILLLVSSALAGAPVRAGDGAAAAVHAGFEHYRQGEYEKALSAFTRARELGLRDGRLDYNLGNCRWRLGDPARALVHYERARRWLPRDGAVRANIELCRRRLGLDETAAVPFLHALAGAAGAFTLAELCRLAAAGSLLFFLGLTLRTLARGRGWGWLAAAGLAVLLLFGGQALHRHLDESRPALVVAPEARLRAEPRQGLDPTATLRAGIEVEILAGEGRWLLVTGAGRKGWVPAAAVSPI